MGLLTRRTFLAALATPFPSMMALGPGRGQSVHPVESAGRTLEGLQHASVKAASSARRDPGLWPFAVTSPWNYPLGSNARYALITSGLTTRGFTRGAINHDVFTVPAWVASASDPSTRIVLRHVSPNPTYFRQIAKAAIVRSDHGISPPFGSGSDMHFTTIDPNHLHSTELYSTGWDGTGYFTNGWGNAHIDVDLKGPGIGFGSTAIVAMGSSGLGGLIRPGELANGIPHALAFATGPRMWNRNASGGQGFVWPASTVDGDYNTYYGNTGNLFFGGLVAIPARVTLNGLGLQTPHGRVLAAALQKYGAYGRDSASPDTGPEIIFFMDYVAGLNGEFPGHPAFLSDLDLIARQLEVVTNSFNPTNGEAPRTGVKLDGGDGRLLAPLAPPF